MKKTWPAHRMWACTVFWLHRCQTRACPGPIGCGWGWRFQRRKDCPTQPPRLGEVSNAVEACQALSWDGLHSSSLSERWRSMLPLYRGENRLRAGQRRTQSHSQSAELRGQWTRSCLGLLPAQEAAAGGFRASPWLGLLPDLDLSSAILAHCACSGVGSENDCP